MSRDNRERLAEPRLYSASRLGLPGKLVIHRNPATGEKPALRRSHSRATKSSVWVLQLAHSDIIVAPVVEAGRSNCGIPYSRGHRRSSASTQREPEEACALGRMKPCRAIVTAMS